jgi:hypothetical protein
MRLPTLLSFTAQLLFVCMSLRSRNGVAWILPASRSLESRNHGPLAQGAWAATGSKAALRAALKEGILQRKYIV